MTTKIYRFTLTIDGDELTETEAIEMLHRQGFDIHKTTYHAPCNLNGRVVSVATDIDRQ